jgi:hypothetical protein
MQTKTLGLAVVYRQRFMDFSAISESCKMGVKLFNREVIPRWKEKFGGASVTG